MFNFIRNLGPTELIIIGVILVVFFGAKRIADLGKTGGETVKEMKKIKKEFSSAIDDVKSDSDTLNTDKTKREGV